MSKRITPKRLGKGKIARVRFDAMTETEIAATSPPELRDLPRDFWTEARVVRPGKQPITVRLDADVLAWFKQRGARYQSRINAVLRHYMEHQRDDGPD